MNMNTIARIKQWFEKAVPEPTDKNITTQIGVHLEEVSEMLNELSSEHPQMAMAIPIHKQSLEGFANVVKAEGLIAVKPEQRELMLDALCDQIVTAVGVAHMLGMDIVGGLAEVNRSNFSKFDDNGNPILDNNLKIIKSANYSKPDLKPFI